MKNGLILTGCAGFVGVNLLFKISPELRKRYDRVVSVDKLGYATVYNREVYKELCDGLNIERVDANILELASHIRFSPNWDWDVVDLASESHVDNSISNPASLYEENALLPSRLLGAFDDFRSIRSFYHISTDEVYGDLPTNAPEKNWFTENSPFKPSNPYSASKVAQDAYLTSMKRTFGVPVRIIRMANQFGNFQHPEKMLPASCLRAFRGDSIKIYGLGLNQRQWTPVDVTAKIIVDKLEALADFDVLHIANKKGLASNNHIVDILSETIEFCAGIKSQMEYVPDRKGHDLCYALKTLPSIDEYFKDVKLDAAIGNAAEFYFLKKEDYR